MTPEELTARVARIATFRRAPFVGTMRVARGDVPSVPQMSDREYRALVARGERYLIRDLDVLDLRQKVRRLR